MKISIFSTHILFASFLFVLSSQTLAQKEGNWFVGTTPSGEEVNVPIAAAKPLKYPRRAERLGVEGYVVVAFDVDETGELVDLRITDSKPKILFDKSALTFFKNIQFKPATLDDEPVYASVKFRLRFGLED